MTEFEVHVVQQLTRIADALTVMIAPMLADERQPAGCDHPPDRRIDFGVTRGVEDWQCGVCGHRTVSQSEAA